MANWCENELNVVGAKTTVRKFMRAVKKTKRNEWDREKSDFCFQTVLPVPEDILCVPHDFIDETFHLWRKKEEAKDEYAKAIRMTPRFPNGVPTTTSREWQIQNWGCSGVAIRVNSSFVPLNNGKFSADYTFDTRWTPPLNLLNEVAKSFPTLTFHLKYRDECDLFRGITIWKGGKLVKQHEVENG